jgi:hypothetical protein
VSVEEPLPVETPPEADPELPIAVRFRKLQEWLEKGGPRFEVWAHDSALDGRQGAVLSVLFPSEFKKRNAMELSRDPHLLEGLAAFFPGCGSVRISLRGDGLTATPAPSRRELDHAERLAMLAELRRESEADPVIQELMERLDAEITGVVPSDEQPQDLESS